MATIYLINPRCPDTFWGLRHAEALEGRRYTLPNLALPTLAALVPPHHRVECCDENVSDIDLNHPAEIIGLTGYNIQRTRLLELADHFRSHGKLVLIGGPSATLDPESVRSHADILFLGEAEHTFPEFWRDFDVGRWKPAYVQPGNVSMDATPPPRWDVVPLNAYGSGAVQTTRGCPFDCEFCDIIVLHGHKVRQKPVAQVVNEIETLAARGLGSVFITDDNFIGDRRYAKSVLREIIPLQQRLPNPVTLITQVTINLAYDDELLDLMARAGFRRVFIGIESPRKESLREANKTQNTGGRMIDHLRKIQEVGIVVWAGMIVGFDNDDAAIFDEQVNFIQESGLTVVMAGMLNAPHGTPLRTRLAREGRLLGDDGLDNCAVTNIVPKNLSRSQLIEGYRSLLERIYDPTSYARRLATVASRFSTSRGPNRSERSWRYLLTAVRTVLYHLTHREKAVRDLFWSTVRLSRPLPRPFRQEMMMHLAVYRHFDLYVRRHLLQRLRNQAQQEAVLEASTAVAAPTA